MGARKFAVMGTLPLGCLPGARLSIGNLFRTCEIFTNQAADMFNTKLAANLENLGATFPGAKFTYVDMYNPLLGLINNPLASGNLNDSTRQLIYTHIFKNVYTIFRFG